MSINKAPLILAIDLGTSGPKVALVSPAGEIVASARATTPLHFVGAHGVEQDPDEWWQAIVRATQRMLAGVDGARERIAGVCCTSQWSGTVAVDEAGAPLHNAIIWMDSRGKEFVNRVTWGPVRIEGYGVDKLWAWLRRTGGIPTRSGKDSIAHILYLKHERPEIYRRTYKFLEPKDYLNLRLTGRCVTTPDAITLHWLTDNRAIDAIAYDPTLLRLTGVEREKLPDIVRAVDIVGPITAEAAAALGVDEGVPVAGGAPDIHSAAVGAGAVRDYAAHLYIGTSSWLVCHVPFKKTDLIHNMASLPAALPGRYLLINEQEIAGGALAFLRDSLLFARDTLSTAAPADALSRMTELAAESPPGSRGLIFTPWLNGERAPVDSSTLRGGFYNLALQHTRADLIRAVLEGVAFNSRWLMESVERFIKRPLPALNLAGGGAQSALWAQIFADVMQRQIRVIEQPLQVNTRGAGLLGAVALGYVGVEELDRRVPIAATYGPASAHHARYEELYQAFRSLYRQNHKLYARLNG